MLSEFSALLCVAIFLVPNDPFDVGDRKQLFIDQRFIAASDHIRLTQNPAQKLGSLTDEKGEPLQGHLGRVIDVDGKVRLYLGADGAEMLESDDGLHFHRTSVRLGGHFPTIFHDTHDSDPARRFKLFHIEWATPFDPARHGVFASVSPDGVNFTKIGQVLPFFTDNPAVVHWDPRIGKYVIFTRAFSYESNNQRRIGRIETDDPLKPWPYKKTDNDRMFFSTNNVDVVLAADEKDPPSDMYYNASFLYPWAQDVYLMFPSHFRHFNPKQQPFIRPRNNGQWEDFGTLETQMAISRDGVKWTRPTREAYFPTGLADEWDRWYAVTAPGMIRRGNYLYQYYYSSGRLHDSVILRPEYDESAKQIGGVGVVRQRLDGFVSADADHLGGWLTTPVMTFTGKKLRLNIDTGGMGMAFVEIQDAEGKPIPGFTLADCEEIGGNFIDQQVYWKGKSDVSSLIGKSVRLHIKLTRGKLYAFQFASE